MYKLEDIDRACTLLHAGARVLDLGCRPGSWMQYACKVVGPHGKVVGVDRLPLPMPVPGAHVIEADIYTLSDEELLCGLAAYDVVLSDMAPDTTGIRATDQARSANLVEEALAARRAPAGTAGGLRGQDFPKPRGREAAQAHGQPIFRRPSAQTRSLAQQSSELYLVGRSFR